jgi:hypothetical protein
MTQRVGHTCDKRVVERFGVSALADAKVTCQVKSLVAIL